MPCSKAEKKRVNQLAILVPITLAKAGFIGLVAAGTKIVLNVLRLIALTLARTSLARGQIILLFPARSLLAKIILVPLATTHILVEIVVLHSVSHALLPPIVRLFYSHNWIIQHACHARDLVFC